MTEPSVDDLLDRADADRAAGRGEHAARLYDQAVTRCRAAGDLEGWTRAVLGAASVYVFGAEPGKLPAQVYDVLVRTTDDRDHSRLAAALARCWAYAGQIPRAVRFADIAVERAERVGDPALLADCLDAALAAHWGPDELDVRRGLATRLDDVAAHVLEPDARLQAHLWGLQVACEALDLQGIHRQIRALELLGEESPRALFFAASRRHMLDLLRGRTDTTASLVAVATAASEQAGLADAWMVLKGMQGYSAAQAGDATSCAVMLEQMETFGLAEGILVVCAEAAYLWSAIGHLDRARVLVDTFHGEVLEQLPRDVNWLLTLQCVLEAALAVEDRDVVATAARLLAPYEGRAVINGGAVVFNGLTDDTLARAAAVLGDAPRAGLLRERALATYDRLGAQWWRDRLRTWTPPAAATTPGRTHLHPVAGGHWLVGTGDAAVPLAPLRGFGFLRELLRRPRLPVTALDLMGGGTGVVVESGVGELIDKQALGAYRKRLADLDAELTEAEDWADTGRVEALQGERDALLEELARATGLGGRVRTSGSSQERARIAVRKAISAAVTRIATVDPALAEHLRRSVQTGLSCRYDPAPGPRPEWVLDEPDLKVVT